MKKVRSYAFNHPTLGIVTLSHIPPGRGWYFATLSSLGNVTGCTTERFPKNAVEAEARLYRLIAEAEERRKTRDGRQIHPEEGR